MKAESPPAKGSRANGASSPQKGRRKYSWYFEYRHPVLHLEKSSRRGNLVIMDRPLKISEITTLVKDLLEQAFGQATLEGEISNFRPSGAGHCYFTLKDESSAISAVMFRGRARSLSRAAGRSAGSRH